MASQQSFEGEGDEILVLDKENETNKLGDVERLKLISLTKDNICLWNKKNIPNPKRTRQFHNHSMRRLSASNLPVPSFLGTTCELMLCCRSSRVTCMLPLKDRAKLRRKLTRVTCHENSTLCWAENRCCKLTRVTVP